tara:strand:+ start:391 stop:762 length:372 start_codon:yes stop_codon:yes gene_type:complete
MANDVRIGSGVAGKNDAPLDQIPLFGTYPHTPGHTTDDTSVEAAESIANSAGTIRTQVLAGLYQQAMTADECADVLGLSILTVRPRFSELRRMGRIKDTGDRRVNATSGKKAIVWEAIIQGEL